MTDPSKERIAAALALAEALVEYDEKIRKFVDWDPMLAKALSAYRATLPRLRTSAEVDAERLQNLTAWRANEIVGAELCRRDQLLCAELTAADDSGPTTAPVAKESHDNAGAAGGATYEADEPEACSCEESESLKRALALVRVHALRGAGTDTRPRCAGEAACREILLLLGD